jgi:VWFA-related protein
MLPFSAVAQTPPAQASTSPTVISTTSQEVLLDVVVRDKKGKSVRDLTISDFQVTDNGEPVKIAHFRLVDRSAEQAKAAKTPAAGGGSSAVRIDPLRQIRLVTLVFDRLGQDGRNLSRQAALELVKGDPEPNVYYSVFAVDQAMNALQPFTNDRERLRKAIVHATSGAFTEYASDNARIHDELQRQIGAPAGAGGQETVEQINSLGPAAPGPQGQGSSAIGAAAAQQKIAELMLAMMQMEQTVANDASRLSVYGLLALVREQYRLPGRKTVVYFSEGLFVPPFLEDSFRNVISSANRANVSVYTVDARGLQIAGQNSGARSALQSAADSSRSQSQANSGAAVRSDQVRVFDTAENSSRQNGDNSLSNLAESTGGLLISNTNDLKKPLHQIDEDISLYYELSYSPPIQQYDGKFRKIAVKMDRADLRVQSRLGYFALPPNTGGNVSPFELPLLTALEANPRPTAIGMHADVLKFQPGAADSRCTVIAQVPMRQLTTTSDPAGSSVKAHLGLVALIRNAQGTVVQKFSQDLPLQVANDKKEALAAGEFTFNRALNLAPGEYTLDTAVADYEGNKAGAKKVAFTIPAPAKGVGLSDAVLVRSYAKQGTVDPQDPLTFQGGKITPSLDTHLRGVKGAVMSVYFVVYPDPAIAEKPKVVIQYLQGGQLLAGAPMDLGAADKEGHYPYVASAPIENFPAGEYEVKVIAQQGSTMKSDTIKFSIAK